MGFDDANRLAGLHQERLIVAQRRQRATDRMKRWPIARGFANAAIDDQILPVLRDVWVQVVAEHPQCCFLHPTAASQCGTVGGV